MANARKHKTPSGSDTTVSRATIFDVFGNSVRDVVPVANVIERSQVVAALTAVGEEPSPERPLVVYRADAPGTGRLELTAGGDVWVPASGKLRFGSIPDADSWGLSNAGLLTPGDVALINGVETVWLGSKWGHITNATLGPQWASAGTGYAPRVYAVGRMTFAVGAIVGGTGASHSNMFTVDAAFRPANQSTRLIGSGVTSGGKGFALAITNGVVLIPPGYATASIPVTEVYQINAAWLRD